MNHDSNLDASIGVVVIGRNEGKRLETCLNSVLKYTDKIVYIDSGSTDGSIDLAAAIQVAVTELDLTMPFTAARARNLGFRTLCKLFPGINYVQFIDGDCEICEDWLNHAVKFLDENKNVAVASGKVRERFSNSSVYNMLCDIEWDTPVGEATACGGNAMIRASAFRQVGGFKQELIAGEEPELCFRLKGIGWKVWRIDAEMVIHDAAILRFSQWWKRSMRTGYAFAEGAYLHGRSAAQHRVREAISSLAWGFGLPLSVVSLFLLSQYWGLLILTLYPIQIFRIYQKGTRSTRVNFLYAFYLVLGKFPEMVGVFRFLFQQFLGIKKELIEYK